MSAAVTGRTSLRPQVTFDEFEALTREHRVIPLTLTVRADAHTPVSIYRALGDGPGHFLMESAAPGGNRSRHSFIGSRAQASLMSVDGVGGWLGTPPRGLPLNGHPDALLRASIEAIRSPAVSPSPLMSGLVGYIGWDMARYWENLPPAPPNETGIPELAMHLIGDMVVHDSADDSLMLVSNAMDVPECPWDTARGRRHAWELALERLHTLIRAIAAPIASPVTCPVDTKSQYKQAVQERWEAENFRAAVDRAQEAIYEGEIFQIVLSRQFRLPTQACALDIYRQLRARNPSPYMYVHTFANPQGEEFSLIGASPEALITVHGTDVLTRPIAGSRPRGVTPQQDRLLAEELDADTKERAEHLMLVDLSRNDLSKVCRPGSVEVSQFMDIERFSHVMHLVSTVTGTLAPGKTSLDALIAAFPAGTLSGAPKPRALQLLNEYEPHRRGCYGGVVGYFDGAGNMDAAITIRSAVLKEGIAHVQAGAGIVADSQPEAEIAETVAKAAAPLQAVYAAGLVDDIQVNP